MGARRAIASRVGAAVVGWARDASSGRAATAVNRGQKDKLETIVKKKKKKRKNNNPHHVTDRCICSYRKTIPVTYRTLQNTVRYGTGIVFCKEPFEYACS